MAPVESPVRDRESGGIVLAVDLAPQYILEFGQSLTCDSRNKEVRDALRQCLFNFLTELVVEHVGLGDGQDAVLDLEVGIELAELLEQDLVFTGYVIGIGGHKEQKHGIALYVAQEPQAEAFALGCSLDYARDIGHHE